MDIEDNLVLRFTSPDFDAGLDAHEPEDIRQHIFSLLTGRFDILPRNPVRLTGTGLGALSFFTHRQRRAQGCAYACFLCPKTENPLCSLGENVDCDFLAPDA